MTWSEWNFEPSVLIGTALLVTGYAVTVGPLNRRNLWDRPVPGWRKGVFYFGCLLMLLALISPLDRLGDEALLSAHMGQHMLLSFFAPLCWVIGTPAWLIRRLVSPRPLRYMTNPLAAFLLFNGAMWTWHLPTFYEAALRNEGLHILEHLVFMAAGVIGWLPALKPELSGHTGTIRRLAYLLPSMFSCTALAALITLASLQIYPFYGQAGLPWGLTSLGDQQLGGLIMWLPGDMLYAALIVWTFKLLFDEPSLEGQQVKI